MKTIRCTRCGGTRAKTGRNPRTGVCRRCYDEQNCRGQEPTEAELDALVARQYANLPRWWHTAAERQDPPRRPPRVFTLVRQRN